MIGILAHQHVRDQRLGRQPALDEVRRRQRLDDARFKLGMQKTVRGLCLEAFKRGIIAPLALALLIGTGNVQQMQPVRRPEAPRVQTIARVQRLEEACLAA